MSVQPLTARTGVSGAADQILVTHCLKEDSLLGQGGFSVRASSTTEPELLHWACRQLDPYELPFEMQRGTVLMYQTPRRLAMLPAPGGRVALVHSTYLPGDTCVPPRPHSFVTHILVYRDLDARSATAAWGAPNWQNYEMERGASQRLEILQGVPRGSLVHDQALTDFLSGRSAPMDQSLTGVVFPSRLESDIDARRRGIRAALHAFLGTFEPAAPRTRIAILAEPGLVALMGYAIARLLPASIAEKFWFSTYEPPSRGFRENRQVRLIGSYSPHAAERSESESLRRSGYFLDMLRIPSNLGPDLALEPGGWGLEDLLTLAAAGDWTAIDEIHAIWNAGPALNSQPLMTEGLRLRQRVTSLRRGTASLDDLLTLRRSRAEMRLFEDAELRGNAWKLIKPMGGRAEIAREFAELFAEHATDQLSDLYRLAATAAPSTWKADWLSIRENLSAAQRAEVAVTLARTIATSPSVSQMSMETRLILLGDWSDANAQATALPEALEALLQPTDERSFQAMLTSSQVSTQRAGVVVCQAASGRAGWLPGHGHLRSLNPNQFASFLVALESDPDRVAIVERYFAPGEDGSPSAASRRLLDEPIVVSGAWLEELLQASQATTNHWHSYWLQRDRLTTLFSLLPADSPLGRQITSGLVRRINAGNFDEDSRPSPGDGLARLYAQYPETIAVEDRPSFEAWCTLRNHFLNPSPNPSPKTIQRLTECCRMVRQNPENLAEATLRRRILGTGGGSNRRAACKQVATAVWGLFERPENAHETLNAIADHLGLEELAIEADSVAQRSSIGSEHVHVLDFTPKVEVPTPARPNANARTPEGVIAIAARKPLPALRERSSVKGQSTSRTLDRVLYLILGIFVTLAVEVVLSIVTGRPLLGPSRASTHSPIEAKVPRTPTEP